MSSKILDYRVNVQDDGKPISVEVTCCGKRFAEIRFKDGEKARCPQCGTTHVIKIQHKHFHLTQERSGE